MILALSRDPLATWCATRLTLCRGHADEYLGVGGVAVLRGPRRESLPVRARYAVECMEDNAMRQQYVRAVLIGLGFCSIILALGLCLRLPWAMGIWPWADSWLPYVYLGAIA